MKRNKSIKILEDILDKMLSYMPANLYLKWGINLTKYEQDLLYEENCKSLIKNKSKIYTNGEILHVHGKQDLILSRYQFFLTWSVDSVQSQSKPKQVLCGYGHTSSNINVGRQKTQTS